MQREAILREPTQREAHQLFVAAMNGQVSRIRELVRAGVDVDAPLPLLPGTTPLMLAALYGNLETVRALLEAGADRSRRNPDGLTPLALAAGAGHGGPLLQLLSAGVQFSVVSAGAPGPSERSRALRIAIEMRNAANVRDLLQRGADPDARFSGGVTALMLAAQTGAAPLVRLLLDAGADARVRDAEGASALLYAEGYEVARLLTEAGADVNAGADSFAPPTPLLLAIESGDVQTVRLLLRAGADPHRSSEGGITPLIAAASLGNEEMIRALRDAGAREDGVARAYLALAECRHTAAQPAYGELVRRLAGWCGREPSHIEGLPGAYLFDVDEVHSLIERYDAGASVQQVLAESRGREARIRRVLAELQDEVRQRGFQLVRTSYAIAGRPPTLLLIPAADKYAVIAAMGTNENGGRSTPEVIAALQELEREHPWVLTACGYDYLEGRFLESIADPDALARRVARFGYDRLDEGLASVELIGEQLRRDGSFSFWWD